MRMPAYIAAAELAKRRGNSSAPLYLPQIVNLDGLAGLRFDREEVKKADPFSIGVSVITAFEAISGVAVGFEAASFVGTAVLTAAAVGASALLAPSLPNIGGGSPLNTTEVRLNRRQPTPHKRVIYGRALTGGDMFFERAVAPYLYHGWMLASHEVDGFEQVKVGGDIIAINATGTEIAVNTILTPQGRLVDDEILATPDYASNLRLSLRKGTADQTIDVLLDADFTSLESNFRQRGIATAVMRYKWPGSTYDERQEMWGDGQAPNPTFLIRGRKIYDPREATHLRDDPTTWRWTDNASLIQADYLRQDYGGRIDPDDIDWDKVRDAADYDDELVGTTTAGELIKRHTINGVIILNQSPSEVIPGLLSANRGFICEQAGTFWVSSSKPKTPVLTIHDGLLTGGLEFQAAKPKRDLLNRVRTRFIATERDYQEVDGPVLDRPDLQTDDEEILSATLSLPFTLDNRRVQRLQKQFLEISRLGKLLTVRISLTALADSEQELLNEVITVDSRLFSVANGDYLVTAVGFADNFASLELQLTEYDADIEHGWVPAVDEQAFEIADLDLAA